MRIIKVRFTETSSDPDKEMLRLLENAEYLISEHLSDKQYDTFCRNLAKIGLSRDAATRIETGFNSNNPNKATIKKQQDEIISHWSEIKTLCEKTFGKKLFNSVDPEV